MSSDIYQDVLHNDNLIEPYNSTCPNLKLTFDPQRCMHLIMEHTLAYKERYDVFVIQLETSSITAVVYYGVNRWCHTQCRPLPSPSWSVINPSGMQLTLMASDVIIMLWAVSAKFMFSSGW